MNGLMDRFCTRHTWSALIGLVLALATGTAAFDTGAYSTPPAVALAAQLPDLSIDRHADAAQPPGATAPADLVLHPAGERRGGATSAQLQQPSPVADSAAKARIQQGYGRLPMHFEPNVGQTAEEVRYLARGAGYNLYLTDAEAVLVLRRNSAAKGGGQPGTVAGTDLKTRLGLGPSTLAGPFSPRPAAFRDDPHSPLAPPGIHEAGWSRHRLPNRLAAPEPEDPPQAAVVRMRLEGATRHPQPKVAGLDRQPGISNYYLGNDPAKWRSGVPHYAKVQYDQVYPGIDLVYYGNPQQLEYDLVVAPGADPGQIRLRGCEQFDFRGIVATQTRRS